MKYDDIKNEQRAVLLFDIIKLKLENLEGYKMRRILQEDSVRNTRGWSHLCGIKMLLQLKSSPFIVCLLVDDGVPVVLNLRYRGAEDTGAGGESKDTAMEGR